MTLFAFAVAVALWIVPGIVALAAPKWSLDRWFVPHLPEGAVALVAATLLFVLRTGGRL